MIRMNNKIKNFYGIGDMFFSFMVCIELYFMMVFLTDVLKLNVAMAGTIVSITAMGDLITSFIAGGIVDKSNLKWGKYRSWLLFAPGVASVFFVMEFSGVGSATTAGIVFTICYLISHTLWNIFYTASRALAGAVTDDPTERAHISGRISAWMNAGRIAGSKIVILMIGFFAASFGSGESQLIGYTITALITSVLMCIGYLIHFKITDGYDKPQEVSKEDAAKQKVTIADMFKGVGKNPPLISVLVCEFLRLSGYYMMMALAAYYCKLVLGNPAAIGNLLMAMNICCLIGALCSKTFVTKLGTKMTTVLGMGGAAMMMVVAMMVSPNLTGVTVCLAISQLFYGISFGLTTSLYANAATYAEFSTGKNTAGFIMGLLSFSIKGAIFIRGLIITFVLGFIGYSADMTVNQQVIGNTTIAFFIIPAVLIAIGILPLFMMKMKDSDVIDMRKEIEARKNVQVSVEAQ
ncbi:MFS transporter [Acetobacterium malicum]|uniref:MFS transporter n=1 Tax=Acetobacterium malicum TaxID=52692 RepID=UPI0004113382|nr:MFS transporter [Acetobacterium dehalogenans]